MAGEVAGAASSSAGNLAGALLRATTDKPNRRKSHSFYDPDPNNSGRNTGFNPDATSFNGSPRGRADYSATINTRRGLAEGRGAFQTDDMNSNWDRQNSYQARIGQQGMAQLMDERARGLRPSVAQLSGDRSMGQAVAAQASASASARGAGGMAIAQQNAANNTANVQGAIANQTQMAVLNERERAEQAAFGAYSGMRGGDQQQGALSQQGAQFNTQLQQQNRDANDRRAMGYETLDMEASKAELAAKTAQQGQLAASYGQAEAANTATAADNKNRERSVVDDIWKSLSDERSKEPASMPGLAPGTKILDPGSHPVDSLGFSQQDPDDFKDPGASDPIAALKAHSDYATRYVNSPGATTMFSDTRAKEAALLKKGQQQGIALAKGSSRADVDFIKRGFDADARPTAAMLDDRAEQNEVGPDTVGKAALDRAIGSQVEQDKRMTGQQITDDEFNARPMAQRGLAPGTDDFNHTQPKPASGQPWWASTPGTILSDDRAKLQKAFSDGMNHAQKGVDTGEAPELPGYLDEPGKRTARKPEYTRPAAHQLQTTLPLSAGVDRMSVSKPWRQDQDQDPIAEANRSMAGTPYAYKPGLAPSTQAPGEVNVGPMAQNLEKSPVAATAVKQDPATGLKVIDKDKALKVVMSGVASLQSQIDGLKPGRKK